MTGSSGHAEPLLTSTSGHMWVAIRRASLVWLSQGEHVRENGRHEMQDVLVHIEIRAIHRLQDHIGITIRVIKWRIGDLV